MRGRRREKQGIFLFLVFGISRPGFRRGETLRSGLFPLLRTDCPIFFFLRAVGTLRCAKKKKMKNSADLTEEKSFVIIKQNTRKEFDRFPLLTPAIAFLEYFAKKKERMNEKSGKRIYLN